MFSYAEIESLNELETLVYNYVAANMQQVADMTIRDLAAMAHVSTSTVLRFCRKMNCERYTEFKYRLKAFLEDSRGNTVKETRAGQLIAYFRKADALDFTQPIMDAAAGIAEKKEILFLGRGQGASLCCYGAQIFSEIGKFSVGLEPQYLPPDMKFDASGKAVVVLNLGDAQPELMDNVKKLQAAGATVVAITAQKACAMAEAADYDIVCNALDWTEEKVSAETMIPLVYTLEMLLEAVKIRVKKQTAKDWHDF
ncbi:MAG: MurR/RpiR family transcriptional regulator [Agathobaculum sp.]|jgi:DNA-binding MurR/RpiR family transcriptional regulator|uniref:MurR/RpiR family transcriptional regulator n=1 Tax=Agathobaculum sp. TaxID=2048138 RepID=UPI003D8FA538